MRSTTFYFIKTFVGPLVLVFLLGACNTEKRPKEVVLYETYCASCHIAPDIQDLPKELWDTSVLPAMASRMGIRTEENHPYKNLSFNEQAAVIKSGVYPEKPIIDLEDWQLLRDYIISMAPESLPADSIKKTSAPLVQFQQMALELDSVPGALITYLDYDDQGTIHTGSMRGTLGSYDMAEKNYSILGQYRSAISNVHFDDGNVFVTTMGQLLPSEIPAGFLLKNNGENVSPVLAGLHRPVHALFKDLDGDGIQEIVVSEFGDLAGKLSLWIANEDGSYEERILLGQPGMIRVVAKDMNSDGKSDLVVLSSQGDEGITILYQQEELSFSAEKVLRFSPVYGTSWFELVDYDGDGDEDIITVHGDNADETYVQKPYHGMRIHLNDGNNDFNETYFYPLNGATRIIAKDFDQDNDMDIALLSTFPDYENYPEFSFVYLENNNAKNYDFSVHTLKNPALGRWFLMDSGDIDNDGDEDILLSTLTYGFTPVPEELENQWNASTTDILILENILH
jgi:hypothetical protein